MGVTFPSPLFNSHRKKRYLMVVFLIFTVYSSFLTTYRNTQSRNSYQFNYKKQIVIELFFNYFLLIAYYSISSQFQAKINKERKGN